MVERLSAHEQELLDAVAAAQTAENQAAARTADAVRAFALARAATLTAHPVAEPERVEQKIVADIAQACRTSPFHARRQLHLARELHLGLDHVRERFAAGALSQATVAAVVAATAHLDPDQRATVDARLATQPIERLGVRRVHDLATALAITAAPDEALVRARAARAGRHVRIRPAPDGMADLVAHLPAEQAAACYGALHRAVTDHWVTAPAGTVTRTRGQILADTLVERLTGQATATDVAVEVQVLIPVEALLDPDSPLPAHLPGPVPAVIARELLSTTAGKKTLRRLLTRDGTVIGGDSRRRTFDGVLETFIRARDGHRCTADHCDAPIRHIDHITRWTDGGPTRMANGRGYCAFHNLAREPLRPTVDRWRPTGRSDATPRTPADRRPSGRWRSTTSPNPASRPGSARRSSIQRE